MNVKWATILLMAVLISGCSSTDQNEEPKPEPSKEPQTEKTQQAVASIPDLNLEQAERLIALPAKCIQQNLPYKSGLVVAEPDDLQMPKVHHPAFYGCFDWHSSVHGHWVIVYLLKEFPELSNRDELMGMLRENLTAANIEKEIEYFDLNRYTSSFERTYGWSWLLKLTEELYTWDDPEARRLYQNIKPLADLIVDKYLEYLPKLTYPIRVGEHTNTAFGIIFAFDYAQSVGNIALQEQIRLRAMQWYTNDQGCPINWEPSGYDFLSPCLQEAALMKRVLQPANFNQWFEAFLPRLFNGNLALAPAVVSDRTDGKLVHLDGLNFSRAWCLYEIARDNPQWNHLNDLADQHLAFSLPNIVDGDYAGEHWLASFALYALSQKPAQ